MSKPGRPGRVVFLSVPESLAADMRHHAAHEGHEPFSIDPAIPLPVELDEGEEKLDPESLTWERIISGMIRVVVSGERPEWTDYYRNFVLAVKPEIYTEFTGAAIAKAKNGDFPMALEISAALEGLFPGAPGVILNKALILEDQAAAMERSGREDAEKVYQAAQEAYERVLRIEPVLPDALFNAGFFFIRRRDYRRAGECFSAYVPLAENGEKKKRAAALAADIEKRGLADEDFSTAVALIRTGDDEKALPAIRAFLEKRPQVWNGWFVLGWALRGLGRWEDALASFQKAVEFDGGGGDTRNEMAICLMELGDLDAARRELEAALKDEPENVKIISNLGVLAMKAGDTDKAAAFFRAVLELDPDDPVAKNFRGADGA